MAGHGSPIHDEFVRSASDPFCVKSIQKQQKKPGDLASYYFRNDSVPQTARVPVTQKRVARKRTPYFLFTLVTNTIEEDVLEVRNATAEKRSGDVVAA